MLRLSHDSISRPGCFEQENNGLLILALRFDISYKRGDVFFAGSIVSNSATAAAREIVSGQYQL